MKSILANALIKAHSTIILPKNEQLKIYNISLVIVAVLTFGLLVGVIYGKIGFVLLRYVRFISIKAWIKHKIFNKNNF